MKYKTKRTYRLNPISVSLSKVYRNSSGQNDTQFLNLIKNWDNIIGKEYAKILKPARVLSKNATVVVSSDKNFSLEANYIKPMLLEKINSFYGYKCFKNVEFIFKNKTSTKKIPTFKVSSITKDKIEGIVCNIKNDDLKESLEQLGKAMAKKGKIK